MVPLEIQAFKDAEDKEHLALFTENLKEIEAPIVRVHSECLTGDALGSAKCDCGEQLTYAQALIAKEGGMIIYHQTRRKKYWSCSIKSMLMLCKIQVLTQWQPTISWAFAQMNVPMRS